MITLYPYQDQWVTDIRKAYNGGAQAVLAVLPTGGGKTICFSWLAMRMAGNRKRVLILCHRKELMRQISEALSQFGIYHGLINAAHSPDLSALVQVGTIATVINRTHLYQHFDYIIMDEAHHAVADTWRTVLSRYPSARVLGVTATPVRGDGDGLGRHVGGLFDEMVVGPSFQQLVDLNRLARPRLFQPQRLIDFSSVGIVAGDYNTKQQAKIMNDRTITGDTIGLYREHIDGMRMIVSCCDIQHAESVAAQFNGAGISAGYVSGRQKDDERDAVLQDFQTARIKVLTFCDIVSEGFDLKENRFPDVVPLMGVANLRKTKSLGLALQIWGRGSRITPTKREFFIFDQVGNSLIHGAPWWDREWSLDGFTKEDKKKTEEKALSMRQCERCKESYEPAPACPYCGHMKAVQGPKSVAGSLAEVAYGGDVAMPRTPKEIKARKEAAVAAKAAKVGEVLATAKDGAEREKIVWELAKTSKSATDLSALAMAWGLEGKAKSSMIYRWAKQFRIEFRK